MVLINAIVGTDQMIDGKVVYHREVELLLSGESV